MPLFEVYNSMVKEKARKAAQANKMASSPEPFSVPEDEFGELIWENGPRKKMLQETKDNTMTGVVTRLATDIGEVFPAAKNHEFFPSKRSVQFGLSSRDDDETADVNDDVVPWMNYNPSEENLPGEIPPEEDYCTEFLNEFSAVFDLNSSTLPPPADHRSSSGLSKVVRHFGCSDHGRAAKEGTVGTVGREESGAAKVVRICSRPTDSAQQHDRLNGSAVVSERCKPTANVASGRQWPQRHERGQISPTSPCKAPSSRDAPSRGGGLMDLNNFSHFLRPVALAKASLEGSRATGGKLLPSGHEATSSSKPLESTLVNCGSAFRCISTTPPQAVDAKPVAKLPHQEATLVNADKHVNPNLNNKNKVSDANCASDHDMPSSSFAASAALSRHEGKRPSEATDEGSSSSSSSSSGNSNGEASNDYKRTVKRKHRKQDEEESGHFMRSEPKEFLGNSRQARDRRGGKHVSQRSVSTKRSRSSEVHNLSERRRRDKINERMRTLQELIPNCNKVDKASMLEEAIEYLKSLQFQLQMMSMGSGAFYMPQNMQNFRMPAMTPPFPAMGMGLGYEMGMYGMNGSSSPMFPIPPVNAQQFAYANSLAGRAQAGMPGTPAAMIPQMLGAPRQGTAPVLMPRLPLNTLLALSTKANMASETPRTSAADPLMRPVNSAVNKPN